ncbi:MAG TPA: hypothetical protein VM286_02155 [Candidatus Thermoplasmatota archaeon]|nr:hypothetical protein [Candidatus Thermoplasmatota archaeon]
MQQSVALRAVVAMVVVLGVQPLASVPEAAAQVAPPTVLQPGDPVLELYAPGPALGVPLSTTAPIGTVAGKASITGTALNPGAATRTVLGTFTPAMDVKFTSDSVASLFLISDTQSGYDQIQANLYDPAVTAAVISGNTPLSNPGTVDATGTVLRIPMPSMGVTLKSGVKYTFEIAAFGVAAAGTKSELFVQFGAKAVPTGFLGAVGSAGAASTPSTASPLYMADKALTPNAPTTATDKTAPLATSCTGPCPGLSAAVVYGKATVGTDLVVTGETVLTLYIDVAGTAPSGASRQLTATLTVGKTAYGSTLGPNAVTWSAAGAKAFRFGFATRGIAIPAGTEVTLSYAFWSSSDSPAATFQFVYGSTAHPAALMIPVATSVSQGPGALQLLSTSTHLGGAPGSNVRADLRVHNLGSTPVNATLNVTSPLASALGTASFLVPANGTMATNVTFTLLDQSNAGQNFTAVVRAWVGGKQLANLTFTIDVRSDNAGGVPVSGSGTATSTGGASGTATGTGSASGSKTKGTPGPALWLVGLATMIGAGIRRGRERLDG